MDELVKRLRAAAIMSEALSVFLPHSEGSAVSKLYNEAADAIEELMRRCEQFQYMPPPAWIPVTERLPEEGVSVQVCFRSQGGIAQAVSERFVNDRNQSYWSGLCGMKPTHWMPLPEPPKEE